MSGRPKRILYVESNEDHTVGGSHQALYDLTLGLDRDRYEPVVLFYQDNVFRNRLERAGVTVVTYDSQRQRERDAYLSGSLLRKAAAQFGSVWHRMRLLQAQGIDLVHLNNSPRVGHTTWLPAARLAGIPCIVTAMGRVDEGPHPIKRYLSRSFDCIIPISRYMRELLIAEGVPPQKLALVYLGIDADRVRGRIRRTAAEVRETLGLDGGGILITMVGNIRPWKGQHVLLEALAGVPADVRKTWKVLFVGAPTPGDADYQDSLFRTVREAGLDGQVEFLGGRDDVADLVNASDIAVHASVIPEPFGLVVPEAMALGKAVVAANAGGPAEVITPDSGVTYDPETPARLGEHLVTLAADPELREVLGRGARRRVEQFTVARNIIGTESVYERLLGLSPAP